MAQPLLLPVSRVQIRQWTFLQTELPTRKRQSAEPAEPAGQSQKEVRGEVRVVLTVAVDKTEGKKTLDRLTKSLSEGGLRDVLSQGTGVTGVEVRAVTGVESSRCMWRCRRSLETGAATMACRMQERAIWIAVAAVA